MAALVVMTACTSESGQTATGVGFQYAAQYPNEVVKYAHLDYPLPGPALSAAENRTLSWYLAFHDQGKFPETVVADDVREYLALFYAYVARDGASFGGTSTKGPFTEQEIDEYARTYRRPQVLTGGFELMTADGLLPFTRSTLQPRKSRITRAVEIPASGHWLPEENPEFVIAELLAFFSGRAAS